MQLRSSVVYYSPGSNAVADVVTEFAAGVGLGLITVRRDEDLFSLVNRSFPACLLVDGASGELGINICRVLKSDAFSAIVPIVFLVSADAESAIDAALEAGADEVLTTSMPERERLLRLVGTLKRAERDVSVNPTTHLPGTVQIERDIAERMRAGGLFAVCYADLDHFKEFNDRYGYNEGDRVILMVSRILRDIVKAHAPDGFIGHIGGDDFIFNVALDDMETCCTDVLEVFDELIPYQYHAEDRAAGYIVAKDRRGTTRKIPLMTLSIGVVTNRIRTFTHTARVSELATEMKSYAKTLKGSVFAVDRRSDAPHELAALRAGGAVHLETPAPK
jgi:diguanylate cyclase (GGDEF)-like protein